MTNNDKYKYWNSENDDQHLLHIKKVFKIAFAVKPIYSLATFWLQHIESTWKDAMHEFHIL